MTLGSFDGILEANVYGVHVPGRGGRAGMAEIVARDNLDLTLLHDYLAAQLPEYARPVFLRIRQEIDVTTTFKQKKMELVEQGYDPATIADPRYFNDPQRKAFVRMDAELFRRINAGEVRL
jgi:fatty-acyl-CoA synthase